MSCWSLLADAAPQTSWFQNPLIPMLVIGVLFYLMLLRPERRHRAQLAEMLNNLKSNDRVVTAGGILGTVVNTQKDQVTLRIDEKNNTKIQILRSAITRVLTANETPENTKE